MESSYSKSTDQQQDKQARQNERDKLNGYRHEAEHNDAAFVHAVELLQSGAKLRDLSPEDAREVAAAVGNQTMLRLLSGGGSVPLAPAPPGSGTADALPETAINIRWPVLSELPVFARDGPLPRRAFPVDCFCPMGQQAGSGVIPDG